jgi:hypothetical protein
VEYKSSDPASFLQIQAHAIEDLLISGKRGQRKSNLKEQDTATKELLNLLEINEMDRAGEAWRDREYGKLVGISDA